MTPLRRTLQASDRDLRVFGLCGAAISAFFAWRLGREGQPVGAVLPAVALVVLLAGVGGVRPRWLRLSFRVAVCATYPLGLVVSQVTLAAVYFLVLSPTGVLLRAFGKDPLQRASDPTRPSYWEPRPRPPKPEDYFRQHP